MRIVHTCLRYPPATGGVETYAKELVERTRDISANRDVRVLTSKLRTHGPISELAPELLLDDFPYVQRLHHASTPFVSYPRLQALPYYLAHHQPDIIQGYSFWYQPADAAAKFARRKGLPFIFFPMYYENEVRRKAVWQLYARTIGKRTFAAADIVAVISPFEQQLIKKAGFPVKRFVLLPPGVDSTIYERRRLNPFLKQKLTGKIILSVGRLAVGKGIDEAIAAMPAILKTVPEAHLVLVGEDFGVKKELQQTAHAHGMQSHVHFWGKLSNEELIAAYQHASILLHTSHYEAFGIVLAESLAAGTPVVARKATAIPYVVPHTKAGLLFANEAEMKRDIIELLTNERLRAAYSAAGKKHVAQHFSWDGTIKKLIDLYDEFAHNRSADTL